MRRIASIALLSVLVLTLACGCGGQKRQARGGRADADWPQGDVPEERADVPEEYASLYGELESKLRELDAYLKERWDGQTHGTVFGVELIVANANRGEELLSPQTLASVQVTLDALQQLGIKGVMVSVSYPLLNPSFPRSAEYLDFYRKVAAEVRRRGLVLMVDSGAVFPNPEVSGLNVSFAGLTLDRYKQEKRQMAETVIGELRPDYYTVENEPSTQQFNTGLDFSVANQTEVVNFILSGIDRSGTKVGAGAGTWDDIAYFESLAENTAIDYIDMHIYPIQGDAVIDRTERISDLARSRGVGLTVGEAWLYKAAGSEMGPGHNPATAAGIFARDAFSFWAPLDQAFLEVAVELSHYLELEFMTPFWMQYLFAYVGYGPSTQDLGYAEMLRVENAAAARHMVSGTLSPAGETYRELIAGESGI